MLDPIRDLPGAELRTLDQISEIVKGATITGFSKESAVDPSTGGECIRFVLKGGDQLLFVAVPTPLSLDGITARIQPLLVVKRKTNLKGW